MDTQQAPNFHHEIEIIGVDESALAIYLGISDPFYPKCYDDQKIILDDGINRQSVIELALFRAETPNLISDQQRETMTRLSLRQDHLAENPNKFTQN